ncbi:TonB-dependent receptor [Porticoccus sp. GXU_MW_L64]
MRLKKKKLSPLFTAMAASGLIAQPVIGAEVLEEITVTASKRAESVQSIPEAISAVSQDSLRNAGINNLSDYAFKVPGLAISNQGNGRSQLNIRGINSGEVRRDNIRASETVGVYFDEIPISAVLYNPDLEPFDLQRLEVLRGPQGTLYGSGSLAGTIRLISNAPDMENLEGLIDVGSSTVSHGDTGHSLRGMINIPLVEDKLAARIVAYDTEQAGWIDNLAPGPGQGEDVNYTERDGFRVALSWQPTDELNAKLTYISQSTFSDGTPNDNLEAVGTQRLVTVGALQPDQTFDSSGEYEQWKFLDQFYNDDVDIYNVTVNYDFENFQLTSSTSYIDRDIRVFVDISSNNLGGGFFPGGQGTPVLGIGLDDNKAVTNFSQELRFTSTDDSDLQWIGGIYYSKQEVDYFQILPVFDPAGLALTDLFQFGANPGNLLQTEAQSDVDQVALFGETKYQFTDKLSATVGIRYFDTDQSFAVRSSGRLNGGVSLPPVREPSEDGINPKFLVSYEANEDVLISLQAARGFRLGGGQSNVPLVTAGPDNDCPGDLARLGVPFNPEGFDSESLWNYELGLKSSWAENRVVFNASLFYIDYQDLQITTRLGCGSSFTTNAGGAESKGVEFEFRALATDTLQVSFGGSYTDAEFTEDLPSQEAVSGDRLIFVPEWKLNAALDYNQPLSEAMNLYGNLSVQYTDEIESYFDGNQNHPARIDSVLDSYSTTNLRIGVQTDKWDVALFANNLFDKFALVRLDSINPNGPGGWVTGATIRPRTVGLNARYKF